MNARWRRWVALAILVGAALAVIKILQDVRPMGRTIANREIVARILADGTDPSRAPAEYDLVLAVFSDYRCSACRVGDRAMEEAVAEDGSVKIIYKEWPILGESSREAAKVALAADTLGKYFEVRDDLMSTTRFDDQALIQILSGFGNDATEADLLTSQNIASNALFDRVSQEAFVLGLQGTPAYLSGPILVERALNKQDFHRLFSQARSAQSKSD